MQTETRTTTTTTTARLIGMTIAYRYQPHQPHQPHHSPLASHPVSPTTPVSTERSPSPTFSALSLLEQQQHQQQRRPSCDPHVENHTACYSFPTEKPPRSHRNNTNHRCCSAAADFANLEYSWDDPECELETNDKTTKAHACEHECSLKYDEVENETHHDHDCCYNKNPATKSSPSSSSSSSGLVVIDPWGLHLHPQHHSQQHPTNPLSLFPRMVSILASSSPEIAALCKKTSSFATATTTTSAVNTNNTTTSTIPLPLSWEDPPHHSPPPPQLYNNNYNNRFHKYKNNTNRRHNGGFTIGSGEWDDRKNNQDDNDDSDASCQSNSSSSSEGQYFSEQRLPPPPPPPHPDSTNPIHGMMHSRRQPRSLVSTASDGPTLRRIPDSAATPWIPPTDNNNEEEEDAVWLVKEQPPLWNPPNTHFYPTVDCATIEADHPTSLLLMMPSPNLTVRATVTNDTAPTVNNNSFENNNNNGCCIPTATTTLLQQQRLDLHRRVSCEQIPDWNDIGKI